MNSKLRIGILIDNDIIPAWSYKMLEEIKTSPAAEIVLIVENNTKKEKRKSILKRIWNNFGHILFRLYSKFDDKKYRFDPDAFEPKNINDLLKVERIKVTPIQTKFSDTLTEDDLHKIEKQNIDILIRLGFRILRGRILQVAKYGVWSYHHGDNAVNRGGPAGFWEVMETWGETGVVLQILSEDLDKGKLLFKSYSVTDYISVNRNRNYYYWKALSFIPSKITELYTLGENEFLKKIDCQNIHPEFYYNPLYTADKLTNRKMTCFLWKHLLGRVKNKVWSLFYYNQWILLYKMNHSNSISTSFFRFKKILPPKDKFWADPHIIQKENKYYIFIEEYVNKTRKGHISVIIMDEQGNYSEPQKVLETAYHLSYPFLIEEDGVYYMIPETKENNTIDIYKCTEFPLKWEFEKTLINNITAVDATILVKDGKYWLFTNEIKNEGASILDQLFIYSSDSLVSNNWVSHPQNPVISDVKQSRPAGSFFTYNGNLYRPSQNSLHHYGYGMKINHVIELNENNYKEETINSIYPNWDKNLISTHTINSVGKLTVIDAQMKRRKYLLSP